MAGSQYKVVFYAKSGYLAIIVMELLLTFFLLRYSVLFQIYKGKLVIRYPRVLFRTPVIIDLLLVEKIIFKLGRKGAHRMIIVYESKKVMIRFWHQFGLDLSKVFKVLKSQDIELEIEPGWEW